MQQCIFPHVKCLVRDFTVIFKCYLVTEKGHVLFLLFAWIIKTPQKGKLGYGEFISTMHYFFSLAVARLPKPRVSEKCARCQNRRTDLFERGKWKGGLIEGINLHPSITSRGGWVIVLHAQSVHRTPKVGWPLFLLTKPSSPSWIKVRFSKENSAICINSFIMWSTTKEYKI